MDEDVNDLASMIFFQGLNHSIVYLTSAETGKRINDSKYFTGVKGELQSGNSSILHSSYPMGYKWYQVSGKNWFD